MIWNCPHCQNALTLLEDQVQVTWKFVRCLHCGGFSMVRKSSLVPKPQPPRRLPPPGPTKRPIIIPAARRVTAPKRLLIPPPFRHPQSFTTKLSSPPTAQLVQALSEFDSLPNIQTRKINIPEPLPELTRHRSRVFLTPVLAATFATLVLVLGVRLHRVSQIARYAQYQVTSGKSIGVSPTEDTDLVEPISEIKEVKIQALPNTKAIVDQLRQQSFASRREANIEKP